MWRYRWFRWYRVCLLIVLKFVGVSSKHLRVFPESLRQPSAIFGHLRKFSEILGKCSGTFVWPSEQFWKIFGKWSEIFGKSSKRPSSVSLYNKQNNTWTLGDMEFIFSCSHLISHSFAALTRSISMWTLEDKFHISARPCIILYFLFAWFVKTKFFYPWTVILCILGSWTVPETPPCTTLYWEVITPLYSIYWIHSCSSVMP